MFPRRRAAAGLMMTFMDDSSSISYSHVMKPAAVEEFFSILRKKNPHPKGELEYTNPYTLLVAVVLSAQATDVGVNKATRALFQAVSTPQQMLKLGEAGLKGHIKTIGLYNAK